MAAVQLGKRPLIAPSDGDDEHCVAAGITAHRRLHRVPPGRRVMFPGTRRLMTAVEA